MKRNLHCKWKEKFVLNVTLKRIFLVTDLELVDKIIEMFEKKCEYESERERKKIDIEKRRVHDRNKKFQILISIYQKTLDFD